ncbi:MAG: hypothetical protein WEE89_14855 [Gemmatimonadota bacterium]
MRIFAAFVVLALSLTILPPPVGAQSKVWTGHLSGDLGIGTIRRGSAGSDISFDLTAALSLTSYAVRPVLSASFITQAVSCKLTMPCSGQSTWVGAGATYTISRRSWAQPFIGAEFGAFQLRSQSAAFAWQGTAGLALAKNDWSVRLLARFRRLPSLDVNQLHGAVGLGLRL